MVGDFTSLSALQSAGLKSFSLKSLYVSDIGTSGGRWHGNCDCIQTQANKHFTKGKKQGWGKLKRGLYRFFIDEDEKDTCR